MPVVDLLLAVAEAEAEATVAVLALVAFFLLVVDESLVPMAA